MMGAMDKAIQVRFRQEYAGFALEMDLALPGRGVTSLFGHSGSGKTTVLRVLAGLARPPGGFLSVQGVVWQDGEFFLPPHQRPIGYVFQEASLFDHLNVRQNVEFGMKRVPLAQRRVGLELAIALLGIEPLLTRRPPTLSGGERQRVAIARALAVSPAVLLLDEPLAALDVARKREIMPYLERLHQELEIPMIHVSHAPDEVARLADYLVAMESGRVLAHGPLPEILARIDLPIKLGEDHGVVLNAVVGARDAAWHLVRADFVGGSLWLRDHGMAVGRGVRVRILARDVSLALEPSGQSSILNVLSGQVVALADEGHPSSLLVRVQVGEAPIVARVTKRSATTLGLAPGLPIWVQIKSVALMD